MFYFGNHTDKNNKGTLDDHSLRQSHLIVLNPFQLLWWKWKWSFLIPRDSVHSSFAFCDFTFHLWWNDMIPAVHSRCKDSQCTAAPGLQIKKSRCKKAYLSAVRGITTAAVPMSVPLYKKGQEEHFQCSQKLPQEGNRCVCFLANSFITYLTARGGLWNPPNL